jgi:hypothetical protein
MPHTTLTAAGYWSEAQLVSSEIESAIIIFHTYEEINRLALEDSAILAALNNSALFWQTQMHCLQASLFLTLNRIFETDAEAHTIYTLLNATLGNVPLFSAAALATRKTGGGPKPEWLDNYMAQAWTPKSAEDLRHLKKAVAPHAQRFREVYQPIRHAIYAHRLMSDEQAGVQLFQDTRRDEVGAILDFLHDLIEAILNLFTNGFRPVLGTKDFKEYNQRIRDGVGKVLRSLQ